MKRKTKKKKINISTVLFVVLAFVGVCVLLYPTASDMYYNYKMSREISQYNKVSEPTKKDYSAFWIAAEEFNVQLAKNGSFSSAADSAYIEYMSQFLNPLGTGMMGYIDIPEIDVHLPIYQGTEEKVLQSGAGYWLGTSLPTGGKSTHCVLTAHNGLVKAKMFTDLNKLKLGDTFYLSILDRVLTYEVDQILVTEPEDLSPLKIAEGEDLVTLYTCTPYGVNSHRLLVRGHRIFEEDVSVTSEEIKISSEFPLMKVLIVSAIILFLILLSVFLFLLVYTYMHRGKRAKRRKRARRYKKG